MKKLIVLLVTISLFTSNLVGCSSKTVTVEEENTSEESSEIQETNIATIEVTSDTVYMERLTLEIEDLFSSNDYEVGCINDEYSTIILSDNGSTAENTTVAIEGNTITITEEGSYLLSGVLTEGQILVDAPEDAKIQLILDGVTITNSNSAAIYVKQADKVFVTTESNSENQLQVTIIEDETAETNVDAAIFAKEDLTLNGAGTLIIESINGNGITSKDDLAVTSGTYQITADSHGLEANNSIRIANGNFTITAGKDALHADEEDHTLGYIFIADGEFVIDVQGDAIDSSSQVEILNGDFDVITAGGSANAVSTSSSSNAMMQGGMSQQRGNTMQGNDSGGNATQGNVTGGNMRDMSTVENVQKAMTIDLAAGGQGGMSQGAQGNMSEGNMQQGSMPEGEMSEGGMQQGSMPEGEMPEGGMQQGSMPEGGMQQGNMPGGEMPQDGMMQGDMEQGMMQPSMEGAEETLAETDDVDSMKAVKADSYIIIHDGNFVIDACDDAFHSNVYLEILGGDFSIQTGDDAIHANYSTLIAGGMIDIITCYEGIEGQQIDITGGVITIVSNDDGINSASSGLDISDKSIYINISGGSITIDASNEGDGLDSNGTIEISGGELLISSTTDIRDTALDYQNEGSITGGIFIATGSTSQTRQNFGDASTQASILLDLDTVQSGDVILTDSNGTVIVEFTPAKEYQTVTISTPDLDGSETYTLVAGDETHIIEMDGLIYGQNSDHGPGGR
ncbi:MAG: carbohydrate-binding domain-containing protein [Eubacteriales bacterium]